MAKNKLVKVEITLPALLYKQVKKYCADHNITMDEFVELAMKHYIDTYEEYSNLLD